MNEQINEANPCKGMLFDYKREWGTDMCYNIGKPEKNNG